MNEEAVARWLKRCWSGRERQLIADYDTVVSKFPDVIRDLANVTQFHRGAYTPGDSLETAYILGGQAVLRHMLMMAGVDEVQVLGLLSDPTIDLTDPLTPEDKEN